MTFKKLIGAILMASPFIVLFGVAQHTLGFWQAIVCFGTVAATVGIIVLGVKLFYES